MYFFIVTFLLVLSSGKVFGAEEKYVGFTISPEVQAWLNEPRPPLSVSDQALHEFQELSIRRIGKDDLPKFESLLGQLIETHGSGPIGEDQNTLVHWICIILTPRCGWIGNLNYVDNQTMNKIIELTRKSFPNLKELLNLRNKRRETPTDCIGIAWSTYEETSGKDLAKKVYDLLTEEPNP
ncbi:MAG: hypothetical protein WCJ92_05080 [Alphaproteobacteria bacterium]